MLRATALLLVLVGSVDAQTSRNYQILMDLTNSKLHQTMASIVVSVGERCCKATHVLIREWMRWGCVGRGTLSTGRDWLVSIANNYTMSTKVVSCFVMRKVGVICWEPFD